MYSSALAQLNKTESISKQVVRLALLSLAATAIIYGLIFLFDPGTISAANDVESFEAAPWVVGIFIGPPIETLLFQTLLLLAVKRITEISGQPDNWLPAFIATSIVFATAHGLTESTIYLGFINTLTRIPLSMALALLAISQRTKEGGMPFIAVSFTHGFYNLMIFVVVVVANLILLN
ncbi:MAG: CPBP family glutamic-type intramembrane protease [Gammaproteobacteria bacterium]|nr:CPBP family glutamic-type intramembrane protease [Gammaproteobacteria bacterium]